MTGGGGRDYSRSAAADDDGVTAVDTGGGRADAAGGRPRGRRPEPVRHAAVRVR